MSTSAHRYAQCCFASGAVRLVAASSASSSAVSPRTQPLTAITPPSSLARRPRSRSHTRIPIAAAAPSSQNSAPPQYPDLMASDAKDVITTRVREALTRLYGPEAAENPMVAAGKPGFGDYQCNAAMGLGKKLHKSPREVAADLVAELDLAGLCDTPTIAGPGFVNLNLTDTYVADRVRQMLADTLRLAIPTRTPTQKVVVDFSSPNIAKEMHIGHLRSTIIGDSLCRTLEFLGHDVVRLNHVGDWGTQFGMLILYLKEVAPQALTDPTAVDIGDLVEFYKASKRRFDEDTEFKEKARQEVVALQSGNQDSLAAWAILCNQSRKEFDLIYDTLDVKLDERGESFYNPFLPDVINILEEKELAVLDEGATCVFLEGFQNRDGNPQPLLVRKSDGGFMYSTTDLAAIRHRINDEKADRVLYVTDAGQSTHFQQVFQVANRADMIPDSVSLEHVPFGLVLGEDGKKFKTRSGDTVKLKDVLNEAMDLAKKDLTTRIEEKVQEGQGDSESDEYIDNAGRTLGIAAVKYADLKCNRMSNYKFSYEKMLALEGNTAPYMLLAYARIRGICRRANIDIFAHAAELPIVLVKKEERLLAKKCLRLAEILEELEQDLKPNNLCEYIFELSQQFNSFYEACPVNTADTQELKESRLALCELAASTIRLSLQLLGIPVLERI